MARGASRAPRVLAVMAAMALFAGGATLLGADGPDRGLVLAGITLPAALPGALLMASGVFVMFRFGRARRGQAPDAESRDASDRDRRSLDADARECHDEDYRYGGDDGVDGDSGGGAGDGPDGGNDND